MFELFGSTLVVLMWIPLLLRFYRAWRDRASPISLAICMLILATIYAPIWVLIEPSRTRLWIGLTAVDTMAGAFFYVTLFWNQKRFSPHREDRKPK